MEKLNLNELSVAMTFRGIDAPFTAAVLVASISGSFDGCTESIFKFSIWFTGKSKWNAFSPNVDVNDFFTKNDLVVVVVAAASAIVTFGPVDVLFLLASIILLLSIN